MLTGDAATSDEPRAATDVLATCCLSGVLGAASSSTLAPAPVVVSIPKRGADVRGGGDCNDGEKDASQGDGGDGASLTSTVVGVAGSALSCCLSVPRLIGDDANAACHTGACKMGMIGIARFMRILSKGCLYIPKCGGRTLCDAVNQLHSHRTGWFKWNEHTIQTLNSECVHNKCQKTAVQL